MKDKKDMMKLARLVHPDKNPGCKTRAEDFFHKMYDKQAQLLEAQEKAQEEIAQARL
jgi:curved DNA-binding protein CbpA